MGSSLGVVVGVASLVGGGVVWWSACVVVVRVRKRTRFVVVVLLWLQGGCRLLPANKIGGVTSGKASFPFVGGHKTEGDKI